MQSNIEKVFIFKYVMISKIGVQLLKYLKVSTFFFRFLYLAICGDLPKAPCLHHPQYCGCHGGVRSRGARPERNQLDEDGLHW